MILYIYCMFASDKERKECTQHMCDKKVYTLKEWRTEALRLKKEHGPQFETAPEYMKMTQCKEYIVDKSECDKNYTRKSPPAPKAAPKPVPQPAPPKPQTSQKAPPSGKQYETYLEKRKLYDLKVEEMKKLKQRLNNFKESIANIKSNIERYKDSVSFETLQLIRKKDAIHKKESQKTYKNREKDQAALRNIMDNLETSKKYLVHLNTTLGEYEGTMKKLIEEIEILAIQLDNKPVPPAGVSTSPLKRCPTGYKRNKTTKRCEKK
jgi:hypothetical protein